MFSLTPKSIPITGMVLVYVAIDHVDRGGAGTKIISLVEEIERR
jgi:hypothetical protein